MSMDGSAARGRAARALAVLTVVLGLLAMHGVTSAHHAAAPAADHAAAPVSEELLAGTVHADGPQHQRHAGSAADAMPAALQGVAALTAPAGPSCDDECLSVAMLCVAVLTGAVLALLLARRRHPCLLLAPARRRIRAPAPSVRHARRPDPVRDLCVSRT